MLLSVFILVGAWQCPIEIRLRRMITAICPLSKNPAHSALAAEQTTILMVLQVTRTGVLSGGLCLAYLFGRASSMK